MRLFNVATVAGLVSALPVYLYTDEWNVNGSSIDKILHKYVDAGATHLVLAFHIIAPNWPNNVADTVKFLHDLPAAQRKQLFDELHAKGAEIILSTGGGTAGTTWFSIPVASYAESACKLAAEWGVDGVDFDLEWLPSHFGDTLQNPWLQWCTNVVGECRKHFNGYITAAPQSPYVIKSWSGPYGFDTYGYEKLLLQYYNQNGEFKENTKEGMFVNEGSVVDLMARHPEMPKDAFVVGKPLNDPEDGKGGQISVDDLRTWGCEAHAKYGWAGGFMFWRGHHEREAELDKIRRAAVPCPSESNTPAPTPAPTVPTPAPTVPTPAPTVPTPAPTVPTPAPTVPTPAPTVPTPAPTVPTPAPTVPTPAPTVPTPAPTVPTPAPTVPTPAPTVPTPAPTVPTPAPTVPTPAPSGDYDTICTPISSAAAAQECIGRIQSQPQWIESCRANCLTLGEGGCLNYMCRDGAKTTEQLLDCVKTFYPYCTY